MILAMAKVVEESILNIMVTVVVFHVASRFHSYTATTNANGELHAKLRAKA